jgi:hypothetical protein
MRAEVIASYFMTRELGDPNQIRLRNAAGQTLFPQKSTLSRLARLAAPRTRNISSHHYPTRSPTKQNHAPAGIPQLRISSIIANSSVFVEDPGNSLTISTIYRDLINNKKSQCQDKAPFYHATAPREGNDTEVIQSIETLYEYSIFTERGLERP